MAGQAYYSNGRTNFPPTPAGLSAAQKIPRTPTSATSQARPQQLFTATDAVNQTQDYNNAPATAPAPSAQNSGTAPAPTVKIAPAPKNQKIPAPAPAPTKQPRTYGDSDDPTHKHTRGQTDTRGTPPTLVDSSDSESDDDETSPIRFETVLEMSLDTLKLDELDPNQTNKHYGIQSVSDLHAHVIDKHTDLAAAIKSGSSGRQMRKDINWFKTTFKSRKRTTDTVAAAATLIHMAATDSVLDTMVREALMASIGRSRGSMKDLITQAAGGAVIDAGMGTARDLRYLHWREVFKLAIEMACCNSKGEVQTTRTAFEKYETASSPTIQHAMAKEMKVWNDYRTAFGRDPMDVLFRAERFVCSCDVDFAMEYWKVVDEDVDTDVAEYTDWAQFKTLFGRAWKIWDRKKSRASCGEEEGDMRVPVHHSTRFPTALAVEKKMAYEKLFEERLGYRPGDAPHDRAPKSNDQADLEISCASANCNTKFVFTVDEQKRFKEKKWDTPRRCKPCRDEIRANSGSPMGTCHSFLQGKCSFGDKCKYAHALSEDMKQDMKAIEPAATHHISIGSDSDSEVYSDSSSSSFLDMECYHSKVPIASNYTFSSSDSDW